MWYLLKGRRVSDDGAAAGSRAVLALAILFLMGTVSEAVLTILDDMGELDGHVPAIVDIPTHAISS